jgi:hypothetical protein
LITIPKLYSQSIKIFKQNDFLSYEPQLIPEATNAMQNFPRCPNGFKPEPYLLMTNALHWMGQLLPSWTWSHTSFFPIDSICSKQKNWTPSIPFWIRLRLTYISRHDYWMQLDPQIRTWPKVQWWYPSHLRKT